MATSSSQRMCGLVMYEISSFLLGNYIALFSAALSSQSAEDERCMSHVLYSSTIGIIMSAIEVLEEELRDPLKQGQCNIVTFDHMDIALSKAFKSAVVDTIHSLPQHQQIILCAIVNLFRQFKKNATTIGELNRSYLQICKSAHVPAAGTLEFTNMCTVLNDQGLLKLGKSKEEKLKRVTLQIDSSDITFSFKDNQFFQNCLDQQ
uniref:Cdc6 C-terminal domain-containing protein n=1 Tax=Ananas comosus var. bracteatus TaxID=296719 RepID=A0A6V7PVA3_ANACO|nr:unnamed protein product [Ananas comosus var. bracteatus]